MVVKCPPMLGALMIEVSTMGMAPEGRARAGWGLVVSCSGVSERAGAWALWEVFGWVLRLAFSLCMAKDV